MNVVEWFLDPGPWAGCGSDSEDAVQGEVYAPHWSEASEWGSVDRRWTGWQPEGQYQSGIQLCTRKRQLWQWCK